MNTCINVYILAFYTKYIHLKSHIDKLFKRWKNNHLRIIINNKKAIQKIYFKLKFFTNYTLDLILKFKFELRCSSQ